MLFSFKRKHVPYKMSLKTPIKEKVVFRNEIAQRIELYGAPYDYYGLVLQLLYVMIGSDDTSTYEGLLEMYEECSSKVRRDASEQVKLGEFDLIYIFLTTYLSHPLSKLYPNKLGYRFEKEYTEALSKKTPNGTRSDILRVISRHIRYEVFKELWPAFVSNGTKIERYVFGRHISFSSASISNVYYINQTPNISSAPYFFEKTPKQYLPKTNIRTFSNKNPYGELEVKYRFDDLKSFYYFVITGVIDKITTQTRVDQESGEERDIKKEVEDLEEDSMVLFETIKDIIERTGRYRGKKIEVGSSSIEAARKLFSKYYPFPLNFNPYVEEPVEPVQDEEDKVYQEKRALYAKLHAKFLRERSLLRSYHKTIKTALLDHDQTVKRIVVWRSWFSNLESNKIIIPPAPDEEALREISPSYDENFLPNLVRWIAHQLIKNNVDLTMDIPSPQEFKAQIESATRHVLGMIFKIQSYLVNGERKSIVTRDDEGGLMLTFTKIPLLFLDRKDIHFLYEYNSLI